MTVDGPPPENILDLLISAREAREGRDRWREVGPTLLALIEQGISYPMIERMTGISAGTAHRLVTSSQRSRTSVSTSSAAASSTPATADGGGSRTAAPSGAKPAETP
jgi:hypothetical protein